MGSVTTTRPVPSVMASVYFNFRHFSSESGQPNFHFGPGCTILIAENIANPDNLGMTLRTADASRSICRPAKSDRRESVS